MTTIVLFGGTGDLVRKMIVNSFYSLYKRKKLDNVRIISVGRRFENKEEYVKSFKVNIDDSAIFEEFLEILSYFRLSFGNEEDYKKLNELLGDKQERIFYLATLPSFFESVTLDLQKFGLITDRTKIAYEKPFGEDLKTAKQLNRVIKNIIPEERVYRVDHYLHKESVSNIPVLRFTNILLQPLWNSKHIDNIQIVLNEDFGVDGRGKFYDGNGAIRDVLQNHLLQILALCAMEEPKKFTAEKIRDRKSSLLKSIKVEKVLLGQYKGYLDEEGVKKNSETETLLALKLRVGSSCLKKVPVYVLHGKNLSKKEGHIFVEFKNLPCKLFDGVCPLYPNSLFVAIQPEDDIIFSVNTKEPGENSITTTDMIDHPEAKKGKYIPDAYENLFKALLAGDQSSFVRYDEIENQWRIVDKIKKGKLFSYEPKKIPAEVKQFMAVDQRSWKKLN